MKNRFISLLILLVVHAGVHAQNWQTQNSGTTQPLYSAQFLDSNTGWAVGGDTAGIIFKTSDGGSTWSPQFLTGLTLIGVHFVDSNTGWAVGSSGTTFKTNDGGNSWVMKMAGTETLRSIDFVDSNTGWVVGYAGILKTSDGGNNWIAQQIGVAAAFPLYSADFVSASTGWAVGASGTILKTGDGCNNWVLQNGPTTASLYSVDFVDENTGWAVGTGGTILKTSDGGSSWIRQSTASNQLRGVHFLNANTGWAVGDVGTLLKTSDGGNSWVKQNSGTTMGLNAVHFLNANTGWAVGYGGVIIKYSYAPGAPPSNLSYSFPTSIYWYGIAIPGNSPTYSNFSGLPVTFTVSPPLPTGLALNPVTGIISGTPTTPLSPTYFTITASNANGSTTATIYFTILSGPEGLSYSQNSATYYKDRTIVQNKPSVTGVVTVYSVNPVLPTGLTLDASSGVISGTPTRGAAAADYTVTASNAYGSTSTTVNIAVVILNTHIKHVILYDYALGGVGSERAGFRASMRRLAIKYGFVLDTISSNSVFNRNPDSLLSGAQVLITAFGAGNVFTTAAAQTAAINFVERDGKALLMIGTAAAYIPCPTSGLENIDDPNCKFLARVAVRQYLAHSNDLTPGIVYVDSIMPGPVPGTGVTTKGTVIPLVTSDHFNGIKNNETVNIFNNLPRTWSLAVAWVSFRGNVHGTPARYYGIGDSHGDPLNGIIGAPEGSVNVLISLDEARTTLPLAPMGDHPLAWTRKMGNGLTAYNSIGGIIPYGGSGNYWVQSDSVVERFNWNLMRYLARDFKGCMDPNYAEYNPEATVPYLTALDSAAGNPCRTTVSIHAVKPPLPSILESSHGAIRIPIHETGEYRILVADVRGNRLYSRTAQGGFNRTVDVTGLQMGIYFVRIDAPKSGTLVKRINLY